MVFSQTARLILNLFEGRSLLDAEPIAKDLFGVSLQSAKLIPEFKQLLDANKMVNLCVLADLIDSKRNVKVKVEEDIMNELQVLEFGLLKGHHTPLIPLEVVSETYLRMNVKSAQAKFNNGELRKLGLDAFRLGTSQKAPIFVYVGDLAKFILTRRSITISELHPF